MIVTIWAVMLSVNVPIIFSYHLRPSGTILWDQTCEANSLTTSQNIFATFFVFAYLLPLSIIAIFSLCILRYITKHRPTVAIDRAHRYVTVAVAAAAAAATASI